MDGLIICCHPVKQPMEEQKYQMASTPSLGKDFFFFLEKNGMEQRKESSLTHVTEVEPKIEPDDRVNPDFGKEDYKGQVPRVETKKWAQAKNT